ncbi:MAG: DNA topoisomerase I [Candidatus Bathyarchaeia archaeon]
MKQLIHNGVLVPRYEPLGFCIGFRGKRILLTSEQEEMAVAWVKKLWTEYVQDPVFCKNFFRDFAAALHIPTEVSHQDFDFGEIVSYLDAEKARRLAMSRDEKKRLAAQRKAVREENKRRYGYAVVDGVKVELANYTVEPSCIFTGRGKHPLRGSWKQGPKEEDIVLNLSPDAATPTGRWKGRVWEPDCMWIARWDDKLRGKKKYVWLSESSFIRQQRDIEKFNKASELALKIDSLRKHIHTNLDSPDLLRRKIATVCYLIDFLKLRVGDEKDEDEADTVGATTLRPEHIQFLRGGVTVFQFLGKDSVQWDIKCKLPRAVFRNLKEFVRDAKSSIFDGVRSENVALFLDEVAPGFTPKVFRTYHATKVARETLQKAEVKRSDPVFLKKYFATLANLEAAKECNHRRKLPKNWEESLRRMEERLSILEGRASKSAIHKAEELKMRIELKKATRDYNLNTSLKSYIDPRTYYEWGKKVDFDWKLYYNKTLQRKFQWVESIDSKKIV